MLTIRPCAFSTETIRQAIRFAYTSACNKAIHKLARTHGARIDLQERQVTWCVYCDSPCYSHSPRYFTHRLGLHAFHTVFTRKPQAYARLLKALSFELSLLRYRCLRKRFRGVVAEGLSTLTLLCF